MVDYARHRHGFTHHEYLDADAVHNDTEWKDKALGLKLCDVLQADDAGSRLTSYDLDEVSSPNTPSKSASFAVSLQRHQEAQEDTLRLMHTHFRVIDGSISLDARISLDEFVEIVSIPQLSLLVLRFFTYMDRHNFEGFPFRTFATTMSVPSAEGDVAAKKELSFTLCDLNDDGFVDSAELTALLKDCRAQLGTLAVGLDDQGITLVVRRTFDAVDTERAKDVICRVFAMDIAKIVGYEAERRRLRRLDDAELEELRAEMHHGPLSLEKARGKGRARTFCPSIHFVVLQLLFYSDIQTAHSYAILIKDPYNYNFLYIADGPFLTISASSSALLPRLKLSLPFSLP